MALTTLSGISASTSGIPCKVFQFKATLEADALETTGFIDNGWRQHIIGLRGMSGTAMAYTAYGATDADPTFGAGGPAGSGEGGGQGWASAGWTGNITATFTCNTGCSFTGQFQISNIQLTANVANVQTVSFDFTSNGTITAAWNQGSGYPGS